MLTPRGHHTTPPPHLFQEVPTKSPAWAIRAVPLDGAVSPDEPTARVLFHLHGPDWRGRRDPPRDHPLPCVVLQAQQRSRTVRGSCRVQVGHSPQPHGSTVLSP